VQRSDDATTAKEHPSSGSTSGHPPETQSLTQLTGVDWGAAPAGVSSVVQERHTFRRTPLKDLSLDALKRLLTLNFEQDHIHLIPYCLPRIDDALTAEDDSHLPYCNLLLAVLANEQYDWLAKPELVHQIRNLVNRADYTLYRASDEAEGTNDSLEYYRVLLPNTRMQTALYEKLAQFEQRISKIAPTQASQ